MKKNILVVSLAPGLGDFVVRIPALRLLSSVFNVEAVLNFPVTEKVFIEKFFKDKTINFYLTAKKINKNRLYRFKSFLEDLVFFSKLDKKNYEFIVILSDFNSIPGIMKYNMLLSSFSNVRKYAIKPAKIINFYKARVFELDYLIHKREKYFLFANKILNEYFQMNEQFKIEQFLYKENNNNRKKNIVLAPGSKMPSRRWPYYRQLLRKMIDCFNDYNFFIVGSQDEKKLLFSIANQLNVKVLYKKKLNEIYNLLIKSKILVCNDSGLMHLGVLSGIKTYAITGPEIFEIWCDYKDENFYAFFNKAPCYPCRKWNCKNHICMEYWKDDMVLNKILLDLKNENQSN